MTAIKPYLSICPVGLVSFARYYGKMYSRHLFSYGFSLFQALGRLDYQLLFREMSPRSHPEKTGEARGLERAAEIEPRLSVSGDDQKRGAGRTGSGPAPSPIFSLDPARPAPAFSIDPTDLEPRTG